MKVTIVSVDCIYMYVNENTTYAHVKAYIEIKNCPLNVENLKVFHDYYGFAGFKGFVINDCNTTLQVSYRIQTTKLKSDKEDSELAATILKAKAWYKTTKIASAINQELNDKLYKLTVDGISSNMKLNARTHKIKGILTSLYDGNKRIY